MVNYWPGNDASTGPCLVNLLSIYSALNNPITQGNFLTSGWTAPDWLPSAWSIRVYYSTTEYKQFTWYYKPGTMKITGEYGQRASFEFSIIDDESDTGTDLPLKLTEELYCEVLNYAETYTYASGYIRRVIPTVLDGMARDDGTERAEYKIICTNLFHELERRPVRRTYLNKKIGFIVKDVINRYTALDGSEIDATAGITITEKRFRTHTPAQVMQWAADLMDWTYTIEPGTTKVRITNKTQGAVRIPFTVTDDNIYDYFDKDRFEIGRDNDNIKNQIELTYYERFDLGPVNVSSGSNIVAAHSSNTVDWSAIPPSTEFYISSAALYRVEKNLTADPVKELRLSSNYAESNGTAVQGYLRGWRKTVVVTNEQSIGFFRQVRGDDGIFNLVISNDTNHFTYEEARQYASAQLALALPLPTGRASTTNDALNLLPLAEGMVLPINLPNRKGFTGDVVLQSVSWSDLGGEIEPDESADGEYHPKLEIELGFSSILTSTQAQARKLMQDVRKVEVNDLADIVEDYKRLSEQVAARACVHNDRTGVHTGLYRTESAYVTDLNHYSFTSTSATGYLIIDTHAAAITESSYTTDPTHYSYTST